MLFSPGVSARCAGTIVACLVLFFLVPPTLATWPTTGLPVCDVAGDQLQVVGCPDGTGGMILVWKDQRIIDYGIYVQRIGVTGQTAWTTDGLRVSAAFRSTWNPAVCSDGAGGAWIVWEDRGNPDVDIMLQHLDAEGDPVSGPIGGTIIRQGSANFSPRRPACSPDGSGGVIVAFTEVIPTGLDQVVAQRFDVDGDAQWTSPAVVVGNSIESGGLIDMVPHHPTGTGALMAWVRSGGTGAVQWVDAGGVPQWNGTAGDGVGTVIGGSRVKVAARERVESGSYLLYQRAYQFGGSTYREWRVRGIADNQYERFDESVGSDPDAGLDANIDRAYDGGFVVGWYYIEPSIDEMRIYGRRFEYDGDTVWEQFLGRGTPYLGGAAPAVRYTNTYFGYRFVWPMLYEGAPVLWYRTMGRDPGVAIPDPGPDPIASTSCSITPILVAHAELSDDIFVGWRDERLVSQTDVYANLYDYRSRIPRANLEVRSFVADPNPNDVGQSTVLRAVVVNTGALETDAFDVAYWRDTPTPSGPPDWLGTDMDGLAPGDSTVFDFVDTTSASAPTTWTNWFRVDVDDVVDEGDDEDDNDRSLQLEWTASPDLEIISFSADASSLPVGDELRFAATVENAGTSASAPSALHVFFDPASVPGPGDTGDVVVAVPGLAAGASFSWTSGPITHDAVDLWSSRAYVDPEGAVAEWDETNNGTGVRSVEWTYPENAGWPVSAGTGVLHSPTIASLPTVPRGLRAVVVTSTDGHAYAWDGEGDVIDGWPYAANRTIVSSATVADLYGDGVPEVIFGCDDGTVHCVNADGSLAWTYAAGASVVTTPVAIDLDMAIGSDMEIIVADTTGHVHVLDARGRVLSGWPLRFGNTIEASPAAADLDGDGAIEIVIVAQTKPGDCVVSVVDRSGATAASRWPLTVPALIAGSPALGDLRGNDDLEIVAGDSNGLLHVWTFNGLTPDLTVDLGLPMRSAAALARVDLLDTKLTAFVAGDAYVSTPPFGGYWHSVVFAIDGTGAMLSGWPVAMTDRLRDCRSGDGPVVWDYGREFRVAVGAETAECFVFDEAGLRPVGTSFPADDAVRGAVAVHDIDADGHFEIVVAGATEVHCYDLLDPGYRPEFVQWGQCGQGPQHTRALTSSTATAVGETPTAPPITRTRWLAPRPNPFNPQVTLAFEVARAGALQMRVFDLAGRRVADLGSKDWSVGRHAFTWNGRDDEGTSLASGVYLIEMRGDDVRDRVRVVLVR